MASGWYPPPTWSKRSGSVKDATELARMERAAAIADAALFEVLPLMAEGVTEERFALELDTAMRRGGAEGTAFDTIVASGENSAKPHHHPGARRIGVGDPVVVDFGAIFEGYRSDMTRTFCVGAEPEGELARIFDVVQASQAAGIAAVRPGVSAKEIDDVCRTGHRRGRVGRALRARHRPRGRPRHPRGPDRSASWALLSSPPASSSPSSPVSTSPASVASVWRTPWS